MTSTRPAADAGPLPVPDEQRGAGLVVRRVVGVVADGMGRSPGEVWVLLALTGAVTVSRATARAAVRFLDYATESDLGPTRPRRTGTVTATS